MKALGSEEQAWAFITLACIPQEARHPNPKLCSSSHTTLFAESLMTDLAAHQAKEIAYDKSRLGTKEDRREKEKGAGGEMG